MNEDTTKITGFFCTGQ